MIPFVYFHEKSQNKRKRPITIKNFRKKKSAVENLRKSKKKILKKSAAFFVLETLGSSFVLKPQNS